MIADDHPATRMGVRMALLRDGFRVLAEAADRNGAVSAVLRERPDVCILGVRIPGGGIEAAATLATVAPATAVVMLSVADSGEDLVASLRAGAVGYLVKDTRPEGLVNALRAVLNGEPALPPALMGHVLSELGSDGLGAPARTQVTILTPRETQIMRMLDAGLRTKEIGARLELSPVTVRRHISTAVAKLGGGGREQALRALARRR